jgi:hypothetical protein
LGFGQYPYLLSHPIPTRLNLHFPLSPSIPHRNFHTSLQTLTNTNSQHQTVPSAKANLGAYSKNRKVRVSINGRSCSGKPAWVPRKYCISQLYQVCAQSVKAGRGGNGQLGYGPGKCQRFTIASSG